MAGGETLAREVLSSALSSGGTRTCRFRFTS
jgi:hypothetical protein